jgi:hypothetical protein
MTLMNGAIARRAAVLLLFPVMLVAGCEKPHKQQNNVPAAHQTAAGGERHQRLRAVCADDIQKYCANAEKKRRCLRDNMDKLSDACKDAVAARHGRKGRDDNGTDD